jgi:predicted esterase
LIIEAEIPANTTATITLPKASINKVTDLNSGKNISEKYKNVRREGQNVVIEVGSGTFGFEYATSIAVVPDKEDINKLKTLLKDLENEADNELMKKHFASVRIMMEDETHDVAWTAKDSLEASYVLNYFQNEGARWETYADGPRPLIMSFKSPSDGKNTYYWLILPKDFNPDDTYSLYMELHGSGGGKNNNPRQMLFYPLQPEIKGVTNQGYRKEGFFIYPWGRGDKRYRDQAEKDIFECLEHFDNLFETDPSRQYLYGFSMGGGGTFRIAQKSMDRWAAIGMYSAALRDVTLEDARKFKDMPVWMTWGEKEWRLTEVNRKLKDLLLEAGVNVKWTEVKGVGHSYLSEYQNDLMDWFLEKRK